MWLLKAVPLNSIPEPTALYLLPKEDWDKLYPKQLELPIICHASLWQVGKNQSGVLLHTAWNSISVSYRWIIDKPLEVSRIMFKAVSHPAHIARNFGIAPQVVSPGNDWFVQNEKWKGMIT
jgi:hypothetical protein